MVTLVFTEKYALFQDLESAPIEDSGLLYMDNAYVGGSRCGIFGFWKDELRCVSTKGHKKALKSMCARRSVGIKRNSAAFTMPGFNHQNWYHLVCEVLFCIYRISRLQEVKTVVLPTNTIRKNEVVSIIKGMGMNVDFCSGRWMRGYSKVHFYDLYNSRLYNCLYGNKEVSTLFRDYLNYIQRFFGADSMLPEKKIFSARPSSGSRYSSKMLAVEEKYIQKGYQRVEFGRMTIKEQVRMMSQATHFAGFHGANLTNLIFASEGCKVYELFSPSPNITTNAGKLYTVDFWHLSKELSLSHKYIEIDDL